MDNAASQQSAPVTTTINGGTNNVGPVSACGLSTQQFINYTFDGNSYSFTPAGDSLFAFSTSFTRITASKTPSTNNIDIELGGTSIGSAPLLSIWINNPSLSDSARVSAAMPITANITEYGPAGSYISGNFSGTLQGFATPTHIIQCSFRVKRRQ